MKKHRKLKKKVLIPFLIIICILLILLGLILLKPHHSKLKKESQEESLAPTEIYESRIPSLRKLYQNDDIIAELNIPSLDFNEIIVKGEDNSYYLTHDIQKNEKEQGAAFIDYRTPNLANAKQINIYGHNALNKSLPFTILENYQDETFFKEHLEIILKTDTAPYNYQIFAVSKVDKDNDEHMIISYENEEFLTHVNTMLSNALFYTKEEITQDDDILVIQTCLFRPEKLLLILAKKID